MKLTSPLALLLLATALGACTVDGTDGARSNLDGRDDARDGDASGTPTDPDVVVCSDDAARSDDRCSDPSIPYCPAGGVDCDVTGSLCCRIRSDDASRPEVVVCFDCAPPSGGSCDATTDPSLGACYTDADCGDRGSCERRTDRLCQPSSCTCVEGPDGDVGSWACTDDCAPGVCRPSSGGGRGCTVGGDECSDAEFCAIPDGICAAADVRGECVEASPTCPEYADPVCGCDGVTYSNRCFAAAARAQVAYEGMCRRPDADRCFTNADCEDAEFCSVRIGACLLDGPPVPGTCEPRPLACPDVWAPVCGCDGRTYSNDCDASAAGVSLAFDAACPGDGRDDGDADRAR